MLDEIRKQIKLVKDRTKRTRDIMRLEKERRNE